MELADGLYEFVIVVVFVVAIGFTNLAANIASAWAEVLDVSLPIIGRPFHFIARALRGSIVKWMNQATSGLEKQLTRALYGLVDSVLVLFGVISLGYLLLYKALVYMWNTATPAAILNKTEPIRHTADGAAATASSASSVAHSATLAANAAAGIAETAAQGYATTAEANAKAAARTYTDAQVAALRTTLFQEITSVESDIGSATTTAERYADAALADLRRSEDAAIARAEAAGTQAIGQARTELAQQIQQVQAAAAGALTSTALALGSALDAGDAALYAALAAAVTALTQSIAHAEQAASDALSDAAGSLRSALDNAQAANAAALTAATIAVNQAISAQAQSDAQALANASDALGQRIDAVRAQARATAAELSTAEGAVAVELPQIPSMDWDALRRRLNGQDLATLGGLLASVPLLRALTNSLADEAGLDKAECRGKVKQICGTDPNAWANLLGGLAAIGVGFSLKELADLARPLVRDLAPVIEKAA